MNSETHLQKEIGLSTQLATDIVVASEADYNEAGNARKQIKHTLKLIKEYWGPKKDQAYNLHKSLVAAEKDMTEPLTKADKQLESKMLDYHREIERQRQEAETERRRAEEERRKQEEEARAKAAEAQRMIDEASARDELDDDDIALIHMAQEEAEQAKNLVGLIEPDDVYVPDSVKTSGISIRKTWKAKVVDESLVPIKIAGATIRPVDMSVLNKLAVASKGDIECPGVEFYQEESTQVRL